MGRRQGWKRWLLAGCLAAGPVWAQSETLREEVRLHHKGATARAVAELMACRADEKAPCAEEPRLVLLTGMLQLRHGDPAGALSTLSSRAPQGLLAGHHHLALAEAAFAADDAARAVTHFAEAVKQGSPPVADRARVRHGEALLAAGRAAEALPLLEAALGRGNAPALLAQKARALDAVGKKSDARKVWEQLALTSPAHPLAAEAHTALAGTQGPWVPEPGPRLDRAERLAAAGRHQEALGEATALLAHFKAKSHETERARIALIQARSLTATGKAKEAAEARDRALAGPDAIAVQAAWDEARRLLRGNDREATRQAMRVVQDRFPRSAEADDALYYLAWLHLQDGQYDEAVKAFDELFEKHPRSRLRDDAAWFQALARIEQGQHADAIQKLQQLIQRFPRSQLVPQARYWIVRLRQLADPKLDVAEQYAAVIREAPETWYALMAALRLEELGKKPPVGFPKSPAVPKDAAASPPQELALARELSAAGLFDEASEEVRHRIGRVKGVAPALALGHALAEIELHGDAYALAARHLWGQAYTRKDPAALALLYPQAYADSVRAAAKDVSIEPSLVWAIMRRESAFRPAALSHANARGLMQLIPPTAKEIAKRLGEAAPHPDRLYSPGINVRYAAWYLARLLERFGHPALAAAAYNGGPNAVARWVQHSGDVPLDLFVERIPYKETRRYVKKVLADAHLYHRFYGSDAGGSLALTLPALADGGVNF